MSVRACSACVQVVLCFRSALYLSRPTLDSVGWAKRVSARCDAHLRVTTERSCGSGTATATAYRCVCVTQRKKREQQALVSAIRPGYRPATTPIRQLLALRAACSNERFESHVCTGFGDDLVHRHRSALREVYLRRPARSWRRGDCAIRYGTARSAPAPRSSPNRCPITLVTQRERRVL